jgi:hemoglobin
MTREEPTVYEMIGGDATFQRLVDLFYAKVEADDRLRSLFPDDLEPGKRRQFLFLVQLFGGPARYQQERGHPRLRMRHAPFAIDREARDAWVAHMLAAIDETGIEEPARGIMRNYFENAATHMINVYAPTDEMRR